MSVCLQLCVALSHCKRMPISRAIHAANIVHTTSTRVCWLCVCCFSDVNQLINILSVQQHLNTFSLTKCVYCGHADTRHHTHNSFEMSGDSFSLLSIFLSFYCITVVVVTQATTTNVRNTNALHSVVHTAGFGSMHPDLVWCGTHST